MSSCADVRWPMSRRQLGLPKLDIKYLVVSSANRIAVAAERHDRHRVRLDDQQRRAPAAGRVRGHDLRRGDPNRRQGGLGHSVDQPAQRPQGRDDHRHDERSAAAQAPEGSRRRVPGDLRQGPHRQHAQSVIRAGGRVRHGRPSAGRQHREVPQSGRLQDRRRGARRRTHRDHDPQGRSGFQAEHRQLAARHDEERADRAVLRPVVHEADRAANVALGLPASEATRAAWAIPNDKPAEEYAKR